MTDFRRKPPVRTCKKKLNNYRGYKEDLIKDFNNRCGYTDCSDFWFGGPRTFHIDHFKPHSIYPELKTEYSNLVYSCSYVNIAKSDMDNATFLDPCDNDYNEHFKRDSNGSIVPVSSSAKVMYKELKLYLSRYQIIWMLDEIHQRQKELIEIKKSNPSQRVNDLIVELAEYLNQYMEYLKQEQ